jgi:hypothetical protein
MLVSFYLEIRIPTDGIAEVGQELDEQGVRIALRVGLYGPHHIASKTIIGVLIQYRPRRFPIACMLSAVIGCPRLVWLFKFAI